MVTPFGRPLIQPVKPIMTGSDVALLIRRRGPTWNGSVDLPSTLTTPKPLLTSVKLEARSTAHHSGEGVTPRKESRVTLGEQDERAVDLSRDKCNARLNRGRTARLRSWSMREQ